MRLILKLFLLIVILPFLVGADYYVSPSGSSGSGSKASPWGPAEINWGTLASGVNTFYLFGGEYSDLFVIGHDSTDRLTIKPCSASPDPSGCATPVILTGGIKLGDGEGNPARYITIDGETTSGSKTINIKLDGDGITDRYPPSNLSNYIRYVEVTGMLDPFDVDHIASLSYTAISGFDKIHYCYLHDNWGEVDIRTKAAGTDYGQCEIGYNTILRGTVNYIEGGAGCDIYGNIFDTTSAIFPYDILHAYYGPPMRYIRIYGNSFKSSSQMIFMEKATSIDSGGIEHIRIYNNIFEGVGQPILIGFQGGSGNSIVDDVMIANNTFRETQYALRLSVVSGNYVTFTNFEFINNILYGLLNADIVITNSGTMSWLADTDAICDYNDIYRVGGGLLLDWQTETPGTFSRYTSFSGAWTTAHPSMSHNITSDPLFLSQSNSRLQSNSPAKDAGTTIMEFSTDYIGTSRPQSAAWDIGAYEYYEQGSIHGVTSMGVSRQ